MVLPPEFDAAVYRGNSADLAGLSNAEAEAHWRAKGVRRGRSASPYATAKAFLSLIPRDGPVLEIGPFARPRLFGDHVRWFDVLDRDGLIARAKSKGRPWKGVPPIHWSSPTGDLGVVDETFDHVFSSHCIEHQPDLIAHLNAVERLLRPGGLYWLVVPDKRFCFDHFAPETDLAAVLAAHLDPRPVHARENVLRARLGATHNDAERHWAGDHGAPAPSPARLAETLSEIDAADGGYIDVHAWRFTPEGFRVLTTQLADVGQTALRPLRVWATPRNRQEFCGVLGRAG